uniref:Protein kinase domain-containing protein n=1 Tax=Poecilia latipinna TaxID=48699 RepID=A0A3B3UHZ4_9TELE
AAESSCCCCCDAASQHTCENKISHKTLSEIFIVLNLTKSQLKTCILLLPFNLEIANLKNIMEEGTKLNIKLEKYVVLQGKLSVYHTEGFLGEGSYGKVVKCTKLDNEELVAVKVLRKDCFKEGKKEAKILRKILQLDPEKNNLLKFIESFKYKGYFCLAFEILDVSVFDFIKSRDFVPLSLPEIRVIAQQLLVALNALKSAGLVHADIKPDNIMFVNHRSQPLKVKLIDFGLAVKASKLWFVGTVQAIGYRAPEVILGLKMNESVDMWSLGCSLAYMYLGYGTQFKSGIYNRISDSLGFISLLKQILLVDPDARITPGEALGHCFITMKSFSGGRNNSSEASTSKMVTDCKIHEFAVDHYVMSSEEAGRTMEDAKHINFCGKFFMREIKAVLQEIEKQGSIFALQPSGRNDRQKK